LHAHRHLRWSTAANYINRTHIRLPVAYHWWCYGIHAAGCGTLIPEHFSTNSSTGWFRDINPSCIIASMMLPQGIALAGYFTVFCGYRQAMFFLKLPFWFRGGTLDGNSRNPFNMN
jgi:hypothetical protein